MAQLVFSKGVALLLLVLGLDLVSPQQPTYGVPQYCLASRHDSVPCEFRLARTPRPQPNQFGYYSTRVKPLGGGLLRCIIRNKNYVVRAIDNIGGDERIKYLYSPGARLEPPENYANRMIAFYNIACPPGHIPFFNLVSISMDAPDLCFDPGANQLRCVDYVELDRGGFGTTENCGSTPNERMVNQLVEQREFRVTFRTNDKRRDRGFLANVVCIRREDADQAGCTRPGNSTESMGTSPPPGNRRRKRDLEDFNNEWKRHLVSIKRMRRQADQDELKVRFEEINVAHGIELAYENGVIRFHSPDQDDMEIREAIKDIDVLHTFDANGVIDDFKGSAKNRDGELIRLPGPGPLKILGKYAYFVLFVVDPRGILPNPVEMAAINNITTAQFDLITEDESERLPEDFLEPPSIDPVIDFGFDFGRRKKRQVPPTDSPRQLPDEILLEAIMNENACNPVLRAVALISIEVSDPDRVEELRKSLIPEVVVGFIDDPYSGFWDIVQLRDNSECDVLLPVENGFITYSPDETPNFDLETVATYQCDEGFRLEGDMTRECVPNDDGTAFFNRESPVCTPVCAELPPIQNGLITYAPDDESNFVIGTIATYQCNEGFRLEGNMTGECLLNDDGLADFDGEPPVCIAECAALPPIQNGFITYSPDITPNFDIGTVATYECNQGFRLEGSVTSQCDELNDGTAVFSGVPPLCVQIIMMSGCSPLPPIPNGRYTYSPDLTPDFNIGTEAIVVCNPGFILVGSGTTPRMCTQLDDGTFLFIGESAMCVASGPI